MLARGASLARAVVVVVFVAAVVLFAALRSANAAAAEALLGFGNELLQWTGVHAHSGPRTLSVNGIELHLLTISTPLSVSDTIEHLRGVCKQRGGIQVPEKLVRSKRSVSPFADGTFSRVSEHEGVLACLDTGGPLDVETLTQRLGHAARTGDLSQLGELRYMLARREGEKTTALLLWTVGPAQLFSAFPPSGDAPGVDPENCPRQTGSRRLLSAREHGEPYSTTVYTTEAADPAAVERWYQTALTGKGWRVRQVKGAVLLAEQDSRRLMVQVNRAKSGHVTATVFELS
jgi:hypothetical protein